MERSLVFRIINKTHILKDSCKFESIMNGMNSERRWLDLKKNLIKDLFSILLVSLKCYTHLRKNTPYIMSLSNS